MWDTTQDREVQLIGGPRGGERYTHDGGAETVFLPALGNGTQNGLVLVYRQSSSAPKLFIYAGLLTGPAPCAGSDAN